MVINGGALRTVKWPIRLPSNLPALWTQCVHRRYSHPHALEQALTRCRCKYERPHRRPVDSLQLAVGGHQLQQVLLLERVMHVDAAVVACRQEQVFLHCHETAMGRAERCRKWPWACVEANWSQSRKSCFKQLTKSAKERQLATT